MRVRGVVTAADGGAPDAVAPVPDADGAEQHGPVYALTGIASAARDIWSNTQRRRRPQQTGAEFTLTVGADRFQVQFDGDASQVVPDSRVTVTGALELVGSYEWGAFKLSDTRDDWLVTRVVDLPGGDVKVQLAHPSAE